MLLASQIPLKSGLPAIAAGSGLTGSGDRRRALRDQREKSNCLRRPPIPRWLHPYSSAPVPHVRDILLPILDTQRVNLS